MTAEGPHLFRSVALGEWADEMTVLGRIFPFGEVARVADPTPDGTLDVYDEEFLPGCTDAQRASSTKRIRMTLDHEQGYDHRVGYCEELAERDDGVHGTFRLYEGHDLPKVQSMLRTSHTGLSIEFVDRSSRSNPPSGPHRQRRRIHIVAVTATPIPAYQSARILSMREVDPFDVPTPNLDRVRSVLAGWS